MGLCWFGTITFCNRLPLHRPWRNVPLVGRFRLIGTEDSGAIRVEKTNGVTINIRFEKGECKDRILLHPEGHPLKGRVQPDADGKTLHELMALLPTLIKIATGKEKSVPDPVLRALEDYPSDMYDAIFEKEPEKFRLRINRGLYIGGYDFSPHARIPVVAYWPPEWSDGLGDDIVYCGYRVIDRFSHNLPLKIESESLHKVRVGDVVDFEGCKLIVEYIDHDNDQDPRNNCLFLRVEGMEDYSQIRETGIDRPIKPEEFVTAACWPKEANLQPVGSHTGPVVAERI